MTRIATVMIVTALVMIGVFRGARWYADNSAMPRYCNSPDTALALVRNVMEGRTEGYAQDKRSYLVASKLLFLVPQKDGEAEDIYLARLRGEILSRCP